MLYVIVSIVSAFIGFLIGAHYVQWAYKPLALTIHSLHEKYTRIVNLLSEWQSQGHKTKD